MHGSRAFGLATAGSDLDRKGVFVPPARVLHGFIGGPEQVEHSADHVHYDVRKFFRLAAACNPSAIEVLFAEPEDRLLCLPPGERLLAERGRFLSRLAGDSFGKYGLSQLRRIRTHRRWLLEPPLGRPERESFGLPARGLPRDQQGALDALLANGRLADEELPGNFLERLDRERRYRAALGDWQHHQEWLAKRNPARAALEARFGYDTKHAMHLVRLLRMAVEILSAGEVHVRRPDAEELLEIRQGAWPFDRLLAYAEELGASLHGLAARSALPERPESSALDALCAEIVEATLAGGRW